MGKLKSLFFNNSELSEKDYTIARSIYIVDGVCVNFIANLISGSYLAALLAFFNISEATSSFIISLGLAAGMVQLFSAKISSKFRHKKPFIYFCRFFERMPMAIIFLLPLFVKGNPSLAFLIGTVYFLSMSLANLHTPAYNSWFMRTISVGGSVGKYCGKKDGITNVGLILTFFICAQIAKHFTGEKEIFCYPILGTVALCIWIIDMISLIFIKEAPETVPEESPKILSSIKDCLSSKQFRPFFRFNLIFTIGNYMLSSLISVFCVQRLHMSLEFLSYVTMGDLVLRSVLCFFAGKIADKVGMRKLLIFSVIFLATNHIIHAFMTPSNAVTLKIISVIFCAVGNATYCVSQFNYMFECMPVSKRTAFMSASNTIVIALGYIATLFTTFVLSVAKGFELTIFGFNFSEMNLLILLAALIMYISAFTLIRLKKKVKTA